MKLTSGYHFFQDGGKLPGCGFVLLKVSKNMVKIQCVLDHFPPPDGSFMYLCLSHSLEGTKPYIIGKIYLPVKGKTLKGQWNFTMKEFNGTFWGKYNCFTLQTPGGDTLLQTHITTASFQEKKPREPFDPFKTTNPAYSWDRAESLDELQHKLEKEQVKISAEILAEARNALINYKHILLGRYTSGNRIYFIIGTPGVRPPADKNAVYRWINKVISIEEYPYFDGYKLYYIDKEFSALVKAVLRTNPAGQ